MLYNRKIVRTIKINHASAMNRFWDCQRLVFSLKNITAMQGILNGLFMRYKLLSISPLTQFFIAILFCLGYNIPPTITSNNNFELLYELGTFTRVRHTNNESGWLFLFCQCWWSKYVRDYCLFFEISLVGLWPMIFLSIYSIDTLWVSVDEFKLTFSQMSI